MHSIDRAIFRLSIVLCFLACAIPALAQNPWLDAIPQQQVGCITGQGTVENVDFAKLLRDDAKNAGAVEIGNPFLTKADSTDWEACAMYKGAAQSTSSFQQKT